MDRYSTLAGESHAEVREKASRFFAYAFPIADEDDFKRHVAAIRKEHHAAKHICHAWVLDADGGRFRAFDAGEPAGSAGKPILRQLQAAGLTQCAIVVVRYFGGTLLGKAGLARAFAGAARAALDRGMVVERQLTVVITVVCTYAEEDPVRRDVLLADGTVESAVYDDRCHLRVLLPPGRVAEIIARWSARDIPVQRADGHAE